MAEIRLNSLSSSDFNALKKSIMKDIDDVLSKEVFKTIKEVEEKSIIDNVYEVYKPAIYERRGDEGGLGDPDNIVMEETPKNGVLKVVNITEPNPYTNSESREWSIAEMDERRYGVTTNKNLPELVEYGHGNPYEYDFPRPGRAYMKPRKFTEQTIGILDLLGEHIDSFKVGLKRHGYKVE